MGKHDGSLQEQVLEQPGGIRALLRRLFDLRKGERAPMMWAMIFALLSVASAIISRAVSDALFLTAYPIEEVADFFIVSNALFIVSSLGYSALVRKVRPVPLNIAIIAFFAVSMILCRIALGGHGDSSWLFGICVWLAVVAPLQNIVCWNAITDNFDSRQARRLFPVISAGSTMGAILAGIGLEPFISNYGIDNLLYLMAALTAACVPIPLVLSRKGARSDTPGRSFIQAGRSDQFWSIFKEGFTTVGRSRLLRSLAIVVFFAALVTNLVDFAFKGALKANYSKEEIGVFYGYFNAIANTGNLILQLFVVAWAIDRFGINKIFRVLPITLFFGTLTLGLWPGFITIIAIKFADGLLRFTFQNSANEVVITPIPYVARNRAKIFIKGAMNPLGAMCAGLILYGMQQTRFLAEDYLLYILFGVLVIWLALIGRIGKYYAEQLYISLRQKQAMYTPVPEEATLFGAQAPEELESLRPVPMEDENGEDEEEDLGGLPGLFDASPVVRRNALELLASMAREHDDQPLPVKMHLLEGLLWRELNVAFALLLQRKHVDFAPDHLGRRALRLIGQRVDDCHYRIFLIMGLLGELDIVRAAYFGYRSEVGRTRAHAVDLVEACLDGSPFHRTVLLLIEELEHSMRLERALRLGTLDPLVFTAPLDVLFAEHDPQLNRLLSRIAENERKVSRN